MTAELALVVALECMNLADETYSHAGETPGSPAACMRSGVVLHDIGGRAVIAKWAGRCLPVN
jgi:hypothetical protein